MGLHNKYPDYFYKSGNLFGKYLSSDLVPTASEKAASSSRGTKKPAKRRPKRPVPIVSATPRATQAAPSMLRAARPAPRVAPTATRTAPGEPAANSRPDGPRIKLWAFVSTRLTGAQIDRWEDLVAAAHARRSDAVPGQLRKRGWLLVASLSDDEATRYLGELERRAAQSEPLVLL